MKRRDFLAAMGGGILVLMVEEDDPIFAQETGGQLRGGAMPAEVNAWLHIAENGAVTVYTGKVEVGQNARTSLTQAAAEELRVPAASIKMVMGDTALTPFDGGTVGSSTTPKASARWQPRKKACCARPSTPIRARSSPTRATITQASTHSLCATCSGTWMRCRFWLKTE
jgi:isoquinoline 1-oxidoreductase